MIGERKLLTLLLVLGVFFLSLYNSLELTLEGFLVELTILLFASLFVIGGFAAHAFGKKRLAWKFLTLFFSVALLNTVGLFYVEPHVSIIFLAIISCVGYVLVLDAIQEGKMVLTDFSLERKTLGVLDEKRSDVLEKIGEFHKGYAHWQPSHTTYEEIPQVEPYSIEELSHFQPEKRFVAATQAQRFHISTCAWVKDLPDSDLRIFASEHEAFEKGLYPCDCVSTK